LTGGDAPRRTVVGSVAGTFGLRGEVKVATSDPADFRPGLAVVASFERRGTAEERRELTVAAVRSHQDRLLVRFEGVDDASGADALRGARLWALVADLPPLPPDSYRDEDLIGMRVVDARLGDLGAVASIAHYPHADMLVVGERGLLVPMLAAYGVTIDAPNSTIATSLPLGFEDL
jgi:16S rRNA processing protein RimM